MRNFIMFFVLFALALPAGSAYGQSAVIILSPNVKQDLIAKELIHYCGRAQDIALSAIAHKNKGLSERKAVSKISAYGVFIATPKVVEWVKYITNKIYIGDDTETSIYTECFKKQGLALHPNGRKKVQSIIMLSEK